MTLCILYSDSRTTSQPDSAITNTTAKLASLSRANMEINTASSHGSISDALRANEKGNIQADVQLLVESYWCSDWRVPTGKGCLPV